MKGKVKIWYLNKVQAAQCGLGTKLPLALCVGVIQLPGELLGVFVLTDLLGLVHQTGGLGCSGDHSEAPLSTNTSITRL